VGGAAVSGDEHPEQLAEFLRAIWGHGPHAVCCWVPGDGFQFVHVDDPDVVAAGIGKLQDVDVWIGAHPLRAVPEQGRGVRGDVLEVVALSADLDWDHETRRTDEPYPTEAEVRDRLRRLGRDLQPSVVVHSGHGLQPWWLLTHPITPDDAEELIAQLDAALAHVDLVNGRPDLASILRLPGTRNHKDPDDVVPVVIEMIDLDRRFTPQYLRKYLPPATRRAAGGGTKHRRGSVTDGQQALCDHVVAQHGAHSVDVWRDGSIHVVRPGKLATKGNSASIIVGDDGDALLTVFTPNWEVIGTRNGESSRSFVLGVDGELHHPADPLAEFAINVPPAPPPPTGTGATARQGVAPLKVRLVELAVSHYRIGRTASDRAFIVPLDGPNVALGSDLGKVDLAGRLRASTREVVGRQPLDDAWRAIEALSMTQPKEALPVRVGMDGTAAVLDLGGEAGQAVIIDAHGWRPLDRSPITFRRSKAMMPLPMPSAGGDLDELFEILNFAPDDRELFGAWLTLCFVEAMPHPIAGLGGEQGGAKSTTARITARLLDPCLAETQKPPRDESDWVAAASSRWLIAIDNISTVADWLSDALCRAVTGDGRVRRQLYSDDEVAVVAYRRCLMLNGITFGSRLRPDLTERLVMFELRRPATFRSERVIDAALDAMRPRVLGALLDRLARTLAVIETTEPVTDLRMSDFATYLRAYDTGNGTDALGAYRDNVDASFADALADDPLAVAVAAFVRAQGGKWEGTASDLLNRLEPFRPNRAIRGFPEPDPAVQWPDGASKLGEQLNRSSALLRRVGIDWRKRRGAGGVRVIAVWSMPP
jgi:hypothetical protein